MAQSKFILLTLGITGLTGLIQSCSENSSSINDSGKSSSQLSSLTLSSANLILSSTIEKSSSTPLSSSATSSSFLLSSSSIASSSSSTVFKCSDLLLDTRDQKSYKTVQIGTQCWMAENLNYGTFTANSNQNDSLTSEKFCYDNSANNCISSGGLYQWAEAMNLNSNCNSQICNSKISLQHQGICPNGWSIPSDHDWKILEISIGMSATDTTLTSFRGAGGQKLKSKNWDGTDDYAFNGLADGYSYQGTFNQKGVQVYYWSSTEKNYLYATHRGLYNGKSGLDRNDLKKEAGLSVRCIKNP